MTGMAGVKINQQSAAWLFALAAVALTAFALFGMAGFRTILAIAALFVIPPLLILKSFGLDLEEKMFFSLFIGIGLFPLLAWAVNHVLPSFRLSVIAAFALVVAAGFFAPRILRKWQARAQ